MISHLDVALENSEEEITKIIEDLHKDINVSDIDMDGPSGGWPRVIVICFSEEGVKALYNWFGGGYDSVDDFIKTYEL